MFETLIPATNNDDCIKLNFPGNQNQNQNNASQEDTDRISELNVIQIQSDIHDDLENDQNATVGVNQENSIVLCRTTSESNDNQEDNTIPDKMNENIKVAIIAALVGFAGIIAAALFAALCTLENQHVGSKKLILKFQDILDPNKWPSHFLLIVSLTIGFTVSLVVAVVSIWRMIMERSFCYRALVFVAVCAFFSVYGFMLREKVPNFTFVNIPGYWVVWLLGCSLVLLAIATLAVILEIAHRIRTSVSSLGVKFGSIQIQLDCMKWISP
ncbi:hypothetical protein CsSME_00000175 [Camellia sinensis var. sinensis]